MSLKEKYASWLLVSDIDGTLNNKRRKLPERNFRAISEFVSNGGLFTLASSRNPESLFRHYRKLPLKTPAIVTNGAGIYDFSKEEYIYFDAISEKGMKDICRIRNTFHTLDSMVVTKDMIYLSGLGVWSVVYLTVDKLTHRFVFRIDNVPKENWGKVIINGPPWRIKQAKSRFMSVPDREYNIIDTSPFSFEIMSDTANKGTAVLKLADELGIEKDNTAAIGDYFNDLDMLRTVAVPACCGQAPKQLKAIAEFVACHCNNGAVADFIAYLENKKIRV